MENDGVVLMNNAFSTFFVAGLCMLFWDWFVDGVWRKSPKKTVKAVLCCFIPIISALPIYLLTILSFRENVPSSVIRLLASVACKGGPSDPRDTKILYFARNAPFRALDKKLEKCANTLLSDQGVIAHFICTVYTFTEAYGAVVATTTSKLNCQYPISFYSLKSYEFFCFKQNIRTFLHYYN